MSAQRFSPDLENRKPRRVLVKAESSGLEGRVLVLHPILTITLFQRPLAQNLPHAGSCSLNYDSLPLT